MDPRSASGFLGTFAPLASDISLIAYILLIVPGMILGGIFARRKMFVPHHKYLMTAVVLINWGVIAYLMAVNYSGATRLPVEQQPNVIAPSIHLLFGFSAQILGTVLLVRMWFEYQLPAALRFEPIKPVMRLTLALWLITAALGVVTYIAWYGAPFSGRSAAPAGAEPAATPAATEDATTSAVPAETEEATVTATGTPEATMSAVPAETEEATVTATGTPEATASAAPAETEEATRQP